MVLGTIKGFPIIRIHVPRMDCGVVARIIIADREDDTGLGRYVVAWQDTCDGPEGGWQPRWRNPRYCKTLAEARERFDKNATMADWPTIKEVQEGGRMAIPYWGKNNQFTDSTISNVPVAEKHYCTGCGDPAMKQCVECGEWRCGTHLHMIQGYCASTRGDRKRGEWCAKYRDIVFGRPSPPCNAGDGMGGQGMPCDHSPSRLVRVSTGMSMDTVPGPVWRCVAHLDRSAEHGWRWTEETYVEPECEASVCRAFRHEGQVRSLWFKRDLHLQWEGPRRCCEAGLELYRKLYPRLEWSSYPPSHEGQWAMIGSGMQPEPLTAARLEQMVREAACDYESEIARVGSGPALVPRSEAIISDPSKIPAKPGVPHETGHSNVRLEPKRIIYCSSAPPRELVESAIVRCGTGLEGGRPVMGPLVWSWPRRREWERHVAFAPEGFGTYEGAGLTRWTKGKTISDRDETADLGTDEFGGQSLGVRCRLCGGWLRSVEMPSWRLSAKVPA